MTILGKAKVIGSIACADLPNGIGTLVNVIAGPEDKNILNSRAFGLYRCDGPFYYCQSDLGKGAFCIHELEMIPD